MLGVQGASHDVGFWGLEGGGERPAPKLVLGYVCVPLRFLWCVRGVLRKCQGSLLGWEPALSCKVLGAPGGGISSWAWLGCAAGSLPRVPFYGHLCKQGPRCYRACQHGAGNLILLWKRDVANALQPPGQPAVCLRPGSSTASACPAHGWGCWRN